MMKTLLFSAACALAFAASAQAEVTQSDPTGFLVSQRIIVKADAPVLNENLYIKVQNIFCFQNVNVIITLKCLFLFRIIQVFKANHLILNINRSNFLKFIIILLGQVIKMGIQCINKSIKKIQPVAVHTD